MARYIGPVCRLCRREGMKLFLKGERCHSEKCAIEKRNFVPGQHGKDRKPKIVGYGLQLREKQKARRVYGLLEGQFRLTSRRPRCRRASPARTCQRSSGAWTTSFTAWDSAPAARRRGSLFATATSNVNGRKVDIPSSQVKANDVIEVRENSKNNPTILAARDATAHAPAPNWLEVDREALKAVYGSAEARGTGADPVERAADRRIVFEVVTEDSYV